MSHAPGVTLTSDRLSVSGDITPDNVVAIRNEGDRLINQQNQHLVVDLSGLGAAHSVVLSMLLCWMRLARSRKQQLCLEGAGERLRSLAALSGLDEHLPELAPQLSQS
jgi:phospholipid transport system transporter-binding protein